MRSVVGTRTHQEIVKLIEEAQEYVVLVSPFLRVWPDLERAIARRVPDGLRMEAIVRPPEHARDELEVERLEDLGVWVRQLEGFHMKVYVSDAGAVRASSNLTRGSVDRVIEEALVFSRADDPEGWAGVCHAWQFVLDDEARRQGVDLDAVMGRNPLAPERTPQRDRNHCIVCAALCWREGQAPDGWLDRWVVCLPCRAKEVAAGRHWQELSGSFCTSCAKPYEDASVARSRCRPCFEKDIRSYGRVPEQWWIEAAPRKLEYWTGTELVGGIFYSGDSGLFESLQRRWPYFMTGGGVLAATLTTSRIENLDPIEVAFPTQYRFHDGYEAWVVERNSSRQDVVCEGAPHLENAKHLVYVEQDELSPSNLWEQPDVLARWDAGLKKDAPVKLQFGVPLGLAIALVRQGRETLSSVELAADQAYLRVDLLLGLPPEHGAVRARLVGELVDAMLASLHSYEAEDLRDALGGAPDVLTWALSELTTPAPLGPATLTRNDGGQFVGFRGRRDRVAALRVRFIESETLALRAAVSSVQIPRVH